MDLPETRYAKSGDVRIAYQITGSGSFDVVWVTGFVSNLDLEWESPPRARFFSRLSAFSRLIRFDKRGTGLSDRVSGVPHLEARMDDVRAVMDAAGCECAALIGASEGGAMSMLFAATYPQRTRALALYSTTRIIRPGYSPAKGSMPLSRPSSVVGVPAKPSASTCRGRHRMQAFGANGRAWNGRAGPPRRQSP
jgi:pimeloyl-ACP methyl ester carboxylesterase